MNITEQLKKSLWKNFGTTEYPAEWDGIVYGGGKLSQYFLGYLVAIQYLTAKRKSQVAYGVTKEYASCISVDVPFCVDTEI